MSIAATSSESFNQISLRSRKMQHDVIHGIVVAACRNGKPDLTLREIAMLYERQESKRIDVGTVSARVNDLVAAKRLLRLPCSEQPCSITGKLVHPVTVPITQDRFAY